MEFWKRNWEKISADTVSGVLIRGIVGIIFFNCVSTKSSTQNCEPADG